MKLSLSLITASVVVCLCGCNKTEPISTTTTVATNSASPAPAKSNPELEKLIGKWERPDGGYILEVRSVDPEGKVDAAYFNPSPIKVSVGRAYRDGGATKLFVELRDVNYPGCTYNLVLDSKTDQLIGQYFQATQNQTYEITFVRLK